MRASLVSLGIAAGVAVTLWSGVAMAATDEQKCLSGRAKAKGKYEKCVEYQLGKRYGTAFADYTKLLEKLAKCRIKYDTAWTKLQGLGTTCAVASRYTDNGNGTVTDNLSGLVWEKKSDNGDIHDKDDVWTWSTWWPYYNGNGTAYATFLRDGLNAGSGFAGANDWRLPTFAELGMILLPEEYPCVTSPCVASAFNGSCAPGCSATSCSCTQSSFYWSATTSARYPFLAWFVHFDDGYVYDYEKTNDYYVRAVRGGL
ncbi:DUF1566 domain-containing protein [Candidatus Binatia bacterium]|nr:DUF1566 domain-containing protein [Candidatus Binatia bacterium]